MIIVTIENLKNMIRELEEEETMNYNEVRYANNQTLRIVRK